MLDRVRKFFEAQIRNDHRAGQSHSHAQAVRLATAALLVEVSRADSRIASAERETIVRAVERVFGLGAQQTRELVALAESKVEDAVSLYEFTRLVDTEFSATEKKHIVELLWSVSFADGELDKYEEYLVRKIADLLHVSHADFMHAKHKAMAERERAGLIPKGTSG